MLDLVPVVQWYAMIGVLTLLVWPISRSLFPRGPGCAWAFARCVAGPLLVYIAWLISSFGVLSWGLPALAASLLSLVLVAVALVWPRRQLPRATLHWKKIVAGESVYLLFFAAILLIRSLRPDIFGLEKFTNWAFVNSLLLSQTLPPPDPWFAGATLNYYYFGHAVSAGLIKLAHIPSAFGYNIAFAHVFAALGIGAFELIRWLARHLPRLSRGQIHVVAFAGASALVFGGNSHSLIYGWMRPRLQMLGWMSPPTMPYRFTNSVRFIGYDPPTLDKTITEFPAYSVYVGDLHAHVLNLPIVMSMLLLGAGVLMHRLAPSRSLKGPGRFRRGCAYLVAFCLLLAWSGMGNTWDLPIYLAVLGLAVSVAELTEGTDRARAIAIGAMVGLACAISAMLLASPFWIYFHSFSRGLTLPRHASPFWQLLALYGVQYLVGAAGALAVQGAFRGIPPEARRALVFAGLLFGMSLMLLAVPELVAVKDIYGDEYQRANTMFKTTYQAYVMLGIAAPVAIAAVLAYGRSDTVRLAWGMLGCVIFAFSISYGWFCYDQELRPRPGRSLSLNGDRFLDELVPGDAQAVRYLRNHPPKPGESVLEAASDSFTYGARISTATGIPTVIGWKVHEWLWRGLEKGVASRGDEVDRFFTGGDDAFRRQFLQRYHVRYVIVGKFERQRYPALDEAKLLSLGSVVQDSNSGTAIVEIDRASR